MNNFNSYPIAGIDYPETLQQFDDWFATMRNALDQGFRRVLRAMRWYGKAIKAGSKGAQKQQNFTPPATEKIDEQKKTC
jgi:hypothetical protein